MMTSPAKTHRHDEVRRDEPADQRTGRDRDRARRGDEAVGAGRSFGGEVRRDQRDDRRHDQRGADALEERPAEDEDGEVRSERGGERARGVDDAADREGAPPADDAPTLPPVIISVAMTSVYSVIAVWIPVTVVPRSLATVAIETFMTELSSVIRN